MMFVIVAEGVRAEAEKGHPANLLPHSFVMGIHKKQCYLVSVPKEQHHQEEIRLFGELLCRSLFGGAQKGL